MKQDVSSKDMSRYIGEADLTVQAASVKMQFQLDIEEVNSEGASR